MEAVAVRTCVRFTLLQLCLLFAGCASHVGSEVGSESPESFTGLPPRHLIAGLPFHPQIEDQCGPASLATMLAARNVAVTPEELRDKLYIPAKRGALTTELIARARQYGMLVYPLDTRLDALLREISSGNPVLVMQNLGYSWLPRWHFSVAIGYDLERQTLTLRSGNEPFHKTGFDLFQTTWQRGGRWAVVIMQPAVIPATAVQEHFVSAAADLEEVGQADAALVAYRSAINRWPDYHWSYFGAGNSAYTLVRFTEAQDFLARFLALESESAEGWNNYAYVLMKNRCKQSSIQAIGCAVRLQPDNGTFRESLRELGDQPDTPNDSLCPAVQCPQTPD